MCGIAGVLVRDAQADLGHDRARVDAALGRIHHRGPDDGGTYEGRGILLGNRRLAIIDLSPGGHQPMVSPSGDLALVLNGEIYNYVELRQTLESLGHAFGSDSDTEVLLAAWREWGTATLDRVRGMFAFAVWNTATNRLLVARDPVGEKPLVYWQDDSRFVFASELKALLELIPTRPNVSPSAVDTFLHYQYVIEPDTPLEGVRKLPAGHFLDIAADRWRASPAVYWDFARIPPVDGDPVGRLRDALDRSAELTVRSDAPVGVALSGGLDSAVIAALATRKRSHVSAFTVGYPGNAAYDERRDAKALADWLHIPHVTAELPTEDFASFFPELVAAIDEPIADVAAYGHYAVARLAARHGVKVLLTGIGGDELFFGYGWVREALRLSRQKRRLLTVSSHTDRTVATVAEAVLDHPSIANVVANRRLPAWWRTAVERGLDYGRLDLPHPDEWVFYQLDFHWRPSERFAADVLSDRARQAIAPRHAYALMDGLRASTDAHMDICRLLFESWLVSNCLALGDRVSMAASVEARIPLVERGVVETVIGLWKATRTDDSQGHKLWLRAVAADLLPSEVLNRPKQGFVTPTREWMQAVNTRYAPLLTDGTLIAADLVDPDRLTQWLARTPAGVHREFFQYKLTLLELWSRGVLHGQPAGNQIHAARN